MSRRPFIAGNWKMNCLRSEAMDLVGALLPLVQSAKEVDIAVCPPFLLVPALAERLGGTNVMVGAQNLHVAEKDGALIHKGAYTGEVSAQMLKDAGAQWVILGHSERRQYFGETDAGVNRKMRAAFACGLKPIACVGETLAERDGGTTFKVVEEQVRGCFTGLNPDLAPQAVIAYEPVWAIGTGRTATPAQAQEVHALIRKLVASLFGDKTAGAIRIQYGGSMNAANAKELLAQPDIDGGLIGGAALKAADFAAIIEAARG